MQESEECRRGKSAGKRPTMVVKFSAVVIHAPAEYILRPCTKKFFHCSVGSPAGRSLLRSGEDGLSIPTGWFTVTSHDTSDMLTTSSVTELLARAKCKRTFI